MNLASKAIASNNAARSATDICGFCELKVEHGLERAQYGFGRLLGATVSLFALSRTPTNKI